MTQEEIQRLARSIHDGATTDGVVAVYKVISDAMHAAKCN
jgi:hypothetical protein